MIKIKDNSAVNINDKHLNIDGESYSENDISKSNERDLQIKQIKQKNKNKEKCYFCNKKLKMINFTCKCNYKFCIIHQNPHSHNCTFDSKSAKKEEIKNNNPKLGSKLDKI